MQLFIASLLSIIALAFGYTHSPTGQPSGVPTSRPTAFPTRYFQATISVNVTLLLHAVDAASFNSNFDTCAHTVGSSLTTMLGLEVEQGFDIYDTAVSAYENQIYDYNFLGYVPSDGDLTVWTSRRLGMTQGSNGVTLHLSLTADPARLGLPDNDGAYNTVIGELKDSVVSHVLTSFIRDRATSASCAALSDLQGITVSYVSNHYAANVLRFAAPTSSPTINSAHYRNRNGVIAGLIVGITAFIIAAMILAKYQTLVYFGFPSKIEGDRRHESNYFHLLADSLPQAGEIELANGESDESKGKQ